ncbi:MAG: 50S ribosomal protein L11 methyltransferase [Firmicutes bacterium]|nr:50S ribosomal protein L11 methyltransferase [Bacillota bacterium]
MDPDKLPADPDHLPVDSDKLPAGEYLFQGWQLKAVFPGRVPPAEREGYRRLLAESAGTEQVVEETRRAGPPGTADQPGPVPRWILTAFFPEERKARETLAVMKTAVQLATVGSGPARAGQPPVLEAAPIPAGDWAEDWKRQFSVVRADHGLVVIPSWEQYRLRPGEIPIYLEPGLAFGTGTHPTTLLSLALLGRAVQGGDYVLDLGCGSGILSIAAARLGAGKVLAVDVDELAVRATEASAARNGVHGLIQARRADFQTLALPRRAQVLAANIGRQAALAVMARVNDFLEPGGRIILAGFKAGSIGKVAGAAPGLGLSVVEKRIVDGWAAVLAVFKPGDPSPEGSRMPGASVPSTPAPGASVSGTPATLLPGAGADPGMGRR